MKKKYLSAVLLLTLCCVFSVACENTRGATPQNEPSTSETTTQPCPDVRDGENGCPDGKCPKEENECPDGKCPKEENECPDGECPKEENECPDGKCPKAPEKRVRPRTPADRIRPPKFPIRPEPPVLRPMH